MEVQKWDDLPAGTREVVDTTSSARNLAQDGIYARKGVPMIHGQQRSPVGTRSLGRMQEHLDGLLADPGFREMLPQYRFIVLEAVRRWGAGPENGGSDGRFWFRQREEAERLAVSEKTVQRAFDAAAQAGVLTKILQWNPLSQKRVNNAYQLASRVLSSGQECPAEPWTLASS